MGADCEVQMGFWVSRNVKIGQEERATHNVELGDENEDHEDEAEPGSIRSAGGLEGELLDRVTLDLPRLAEANVA